MNFMLWCLIGLGAFLLGCVIFLRGSKYDKNSDGCEGICLALFCLTIFGPFSYFILLLAIMLAQRTREAIYTFFWNLVNLNIKRKD